MAKKWYIGISPRGIPFNTNEKGEYINRCGKIIPKEKLFPELSPEKKTKNKIIKLNKKSSES